MENKVAYHIMYSRNKDGVLQFDEFADAIAYMRKQFPFSRQHIGELVKMFETYDVDKSGTLDIKEMRQMLMDIDKKMTHYPAVSCISHHVYQSMH